MLQESEAKLRNDVVLVDENQMTKSQKESMSVSKRDLDSYLGRLFAEKRENRRKTKGAFSHRKDKRPPLYKQWGYSCQEEMDFKRWGGACEYFAKQDGHPKQERAKLAISWAKSHE